MGIEDFGELEFLQGLFAFIFVIISVYTGIRILLKYFSLRQKEYFSIGITWLLLSGGWWRAFVNFPYILIFGVESGLSIAIDVVFVPPAILFWIYSFSHLIYPEAEKKIVIPFAAFIILVEILIISFLIIDPNVIGTTPTPFNNDYSLIYSLFLAFILVLALFTGIIFAVKSMAYSDKKIKWRGRFILIAFISFVSSTIIDAFFPITAITLVLARLLLISSAIEYYLGFLMPERLTKFLIKE